MKYPSEPTLTCLQHSQKKRYIASQYANTNIMGSQVIGGIQERADAFIKKCSEFQGASIDVYVSSRYYVLWTQLTL